MAKLMESKRQKTFNPLGTVKSTSIFIFILFQFFPVFPAVCLYYFDRILMKAYLVKIYSAIPMSRFHYNACWQAKYESWNLVVEKRSPGNKYVSRKECRRIEKVIRDWIGELYPGIRVAGDIVKKYVIFGNGIWARESESNIPLFFMGPHHYNFLAIRDFCMLMIKTFSNLICEGVYIVISPLLNISREIW